MQVYWLNLDYLEVARAALRCSAPFTAMLYVEYWCKAQYGRLTLLDVDLLTQVDSHRSCSPHSIRTLKLWYLDGHAGSCCPSACQHISLNLVLRKPYDTMDANSLLKLQSSGSVTL